MAEVVSRQTGPDRETAGTDSDAPPPHSIPWRQVAGQYGTGESGLDAARVEQLRSRWGFNEVPEAPPERLLMRVARQFNDVVIWVLIAAAVISGASREWVDAVVILAIVVLNGLLGFFQEERAGRALAALRKLSAPRAKVRREGVVLSLPSREVVPGDLIVLEAGDDVPADARLTSAHALTVQEASLTGESVPVVKDPTAVLNPEIPLADRTNMVHAGTHVASGNAEAIAVATGPNSEFGRIAALLRATEPQPTPLQRRLARLGHLLIAASLAVVAIIFTLHVFRGGNLFDAFMTSVALAVAAVPEGLPTVVTIALALGVQRMAHRHALVRRLPSVETLGSVTVICTDKTGTLTRGEMTVTEVVAGTSGYHVNGTGHLPLGGFTFRDSGRPAIPAHEAQLLNVLTAAAWCNRPDLFRQHDSADRIAGDPTEVALLVAAAKANIHPRLGDAVILDEIPFDSDRKRMSVLIRTHSGKVSMYTKGAPEVVLERCDSEFTGTSSVPLTHERRTQLLVEARELASRALRVLAVASREFAASDAVDHDENHLTFAGLVGMIDPARTEARAAVEACRAADIRPVMITGDHPDTARAVARSVGIPCEEGQQLTGPELDKLRDEEFTRRVEDISVYSRVTAEHKLRVVRAWRSRGQIIAMTGDGINDAPAVEAADIGIAMGMSGTDVTRQAADMVLTDDNFATIVNAVEEGRAIFENIRKAVHYLLSCNAAEIAFVFIATLLGWPLPLTAIHLLWINLITDGLPALALGIDRPEPGLMLRPPRPPEENLITRRGGFLIIFHAALIATATAAAFALAYRNSRDSLPQARTIAFCVLAYSELFYSLSSRSLRFVLPRLGIFSNPLLLLAVVVSGLLQCSIVMFPPAARIFAVSHLSPARWLLVALFSLAPVTVVEIHKLLIRREIPE